jgi:hypothetical protein
MMVCGIIGTHLTDSRDQEAGANALVRRRSRRGKNRVVLSRLCQHSAKLGAMWRRQRCVACSRTRVGRRVFCGGAAEWRHFEHGSMPKMRHHA